ncbi:MAG: XrtA system polysaccharide deacetylase [Phycisphaerae bacterium]
MADANVHVVSFDVEEYFHAEAAQLSGVRREDWAGLSSRLQQPVEQILQLLDESGVRATFFILGWVAQHHPELVRRIADAGHEVASHGMGHHMLDRLDPKSFAGELRDSRSLLEDLAGRAVFGFRAPTFSITRRTAWALDVLADCGYAYDSSIFPIRHDRYGVPDAPRCPHWAQGPGQGRILEIPPLTRRWLGSNLPAAGGGYLRLFPVRLIASALKQAQRENRPGMLYLHPWELDPDHPEMGMRGLQKFRHRVNLARTANKLKWLLDRFEFAPTADLLGRWQSSPETCQTFCYSDDPK